MPFFADFWPFLLFLVHFHISVGAFLAVFPIFLGFVGIFWGGRQLFRRFWGNFGHFWPLLGHFRTFLGSKNFLAFFAEKWHFGPGIRRRRQKLYSTPPGGQRYSSATIPKPGIMWVKWVKGGWVKGVREGSERMEWVGMGAGSEWS